MKDSSGNIIFIIFTAVVLFGALTFVATSGNKSSKTGLIEHQAELDNATIRACNTSIQATINRLKSNKACKDSEISYELDDGTNVNPNARADGSCDIFGPNGGNIEPCGYYAQGEMPCLLDLEIGENCGGVVYAGINGGERLYTTPEDSPRDQWSGGSYNNTTSVTDENDGAVNTDTLISLTSHAGYPFDAAIYCRSLGPKWYLPARWELNTLFLNKDEIDNFYMSGTTQYWSSTESASHAATAIRFDTGSHQAATKNGNLNIRCTRRY